MAPIELKPSNCEHNTLVAPVSFQDFWQRMDAKCLKFGTKWNWLLAWLVTLVCPGNIVFVWLNTLWVIGRTGWPSHVSHQCVGQKQPLVYMHHCVCLMHCLNGWCWGDNAISIDFFWSADMKSECFLFYVTWLSLVLSKACVCIHPSPDPESLICVCNWGVCFGNWLCKVFMLVVFLPNELSHGDNRAVPPDERPPWWETTSLSRPLLVVGYIFPIKFRCK